MCRDLAIKAAMSGLTLEGLVQFPSLRLFGAGLGKMTSVGAYRATTFPESNIIVLVYEL